MVKNIVIKWVGKKGGEGRGREGSMIAVGLHKKNRQAKTNYTE